tara:strand:- start:6 stop:200 length:195 start_codon:yes stop_codon:yes gene_type:complete
MKYQTGQGRLDKLPEGEERSYFPVADENHTFAHRHAVGWEPSTASIADSFCNLGILYFQECSGR